MSKDPRDRERIYFCTDLHGSEVCFRKFLNAAEAYGASTVIMGGDCTGKMVVPFVDEAGGSRCAWEAGPDGLLAGEELERAVKEIRNVGLYPVRLSPERYQELSESPEEMDELVRQLIGERLTEWIGVAREKLGDSGVRVIMTPGNDDDMFVDEILSGDDFVESPEGTIARVGGHEMLSLSWASPTPWDTPRECSEEELGEKIAALAERVEDMDRAIFNIHPPPYGSGLDVAPELGEGARMNRGGAVLASVGSHAVREAIHRYQPALTLHGHIHESRAVQRLGKTISVNPGSTYSQGTLQGVVIELKKGRVKNQALVIG